MNSNPYPALRRPSGTFPEASSRPPRRHSSLLFPLLSPSTLNLELSTSASPSLRSSAPRASLLYPLPSPTLLPFALPYLLCFQVLPHSFARFCKHSKINPFVFKRFRTLCQYHPGWGTLSPIPKRLSLSLLLCELCDLGVLCVKFLSAVLLPKPFRMNTCKGNNILDKSERLRYYLACEERYERQTKDTSASHRPLRGPR